MDIQRLRNLTTGRLHTHMAHIYEDIERLTGEPGVMTHMLPNAMRALEPYLRELVPDPRFWNGCYDPSHIGAVEVPPMDEAAREAFWTRYRELPSPLDGPPTFLIFGREVEP